MTFYLLPNYYGYRDRRITQKGWTINLRITAGETSKPSTRREDQPTTGHGTRSPEPNGTTSPRHALWNATKKGKPSKEDHEKGSAIRTGATAKTQETRWNHHHRRENLTARQALERYPQLRRFVQQGKPLKEKSLQAKARVWFKKGKIPNHILNPEPEVVPRGRLLGNNVVGHYTVHSEGNTSPRDFLNFIRNAVIMFLRERPQNKVQLSLICVLMRMDPATAEVTNEEKASFNSKQESVFESTDLEAVYERMVTEMLEEFATYLRNGSGWMLKRVVRLDSSEYPPTSSCPRSLQKGRP